MLCDSANTASQVHEAVHGFKGTGAEEDDAHMSQQVTSDPDCLQGRSLLAKASQAQPTVGRPDLFWHAHQDDPSKGGPETGKSIAKSPREESVALENPAALQPH